MTLKALAGLKGICCGLRCRMSWLILLLANIALVARMGNTWNNEL